MCELLLARSEQAAVYVAYIDGYPEGFELEIRASTSVAYGELRREGDDSGPDVFGRNATGSQINLTSTQVSTRETSTTP